MPATVGCIVLITGFRIGPYVTLSKIIDEFLGTDSFRFGVCHKLTCDMWTIDKLHGTFTFQNSYFISPQYIGDKVDRRILIWCTYSAIVKSVCRHNQLRICSETLCRSTPKTKVLRKIQNVTVVSFFTFVDYQNRSGIKYRYKNN